MNLRDTVSEIELFSARNARNKITDDESRCSGIIAENQVPLKIFATLGIFFQRLAFILHAVV